MLCFIVYHNIMFKYDNHYLLLFADSEDDVDDDVVEIDYIID